MLVYHAHVIIKKKRINERHKDQYVDEGIRLNVVLKARIVSTYADKSKRGRDCCKEVPRGVSVLEEGHTQ